MDSKSGFKLLPRSLKIFFVIMFVLILMSLLSFGKDSYFILGLLIRGIPAQIIYILLNVLAPTVLLFAMLKRYPWTYKYAIYYLSFFVLNSLTGIIIYSLLIPEGFLNDMWLIVAAGVFQTIILSVFLILFLLAKNYFKPSYES